MPTKGRPLTPRELEVLVTLATERHALGRPDSERLRESAEPATVRSTLHLIGLSVAETDALLREAVARVAREQDEVRRHRRRIILAAIALAAAGVVPVGLLLLNRKEEPARTEQAPAEPREELPGAPGPAPDIARPSEAPREEAAPAAPEQRASPPDEPAPPPSLEAQLLEKLSEKGLAVAGELDGAAIGFAERAEAALDGIAEETGADYGLVVDSRCEPQGTVAGEPPANDTLQSVRATARAALFVLADGKRVAHAEASQVEVHVDPAYACRRATERAAAQVVREFEVPPPE